MRYHVLIRGNKILSFYLREVAEMYALMYEGIVIDDGDKNV